MAAIPAMNISKFPSQQSSGWSMLLCLNMGQNHQNLMVHWHFPLLRLGTFTSMWSQLVLLEFRNWIHWIRENLWESRFRGTMEHPIFTASYHDIFFVQPPKRCHLQCFKDGSSMTFPIFFQASNFPATFGSLPSWFISRPTGEFMDIYGDILINYKVRSVAKLKQN